MCKLTSQNPEHIFSEAFVYMIKKKKDVNIKQYSGASIRSYNNNVSELSKDLYECSVLEYWGIVICLSSCLF